MIVVFDSGVWVSAARFGGVPRQALVQALSQDETIVCAEIENETIRIMRSNLASWKAKSAPVCRFFFETPQESL